ncbi:alanine racemase [Phytohabitans kaempferiae]|uniref:Alanine racemase n=1 Tax=Phytohabitans kaempferiae TaxID=1620943 RepID=A0ABV6M990_9ACTN
MRVEVVVDLMAIRDNVRWLIQQTSAQVLVMVKANGYGHGSVAAARAALAGGARWLGTAFLEEAITLRSAGIESPILACIVRPGDDLAAAASRGIDISVSAPWAVEAARDAAQQVGRPARLHLEVDTGMSRGGP